VPKPSSSTSSTTSVWPLNRATAEISSAILLHHIPEGVDYAKSTGIDLMLTGHTHNGQIVPFNLLVKMIFSRSEGLYDVDGMKLYVSPGTGTWGPPMRLGSMNEITLLHLI